MGFSKYNQTYLAPGKCVGTLPAYCECASRIKSACEAMKNLPSDPVADPVWYCVSACANDEGPDICESECKEWCFDHSGSYNNCDDLIPPECKNGNTR